MDEVPDANLSVHQLRPAMRVRTELCAAGSRAGKAVFWSLDYWCAVGNQMTCLARPMLVTTTIGHAPGRYR